MHFSCPKKGARKMMLVRILKAKTNNFEHSQIIGLGFSGGSLQANLMDSLSKDIATSKSARVIVPVCNIYLEYMMAYFFPHTFTKSSCSQ